MFFCTQVIPWNQVNSNEPVPSEISATSLLLLFSPIISQEIILPATCMYSVEGNIFYLFYFCFIDMPVGKVL